MGRSRRETKTSRNNLFKNRPMHRSPHCQGGPESTERGRAWKTPEQARTPWKPATNLDEPTISSLDPLAM
jgi:hypothetical protein